MRFSVLFILFLLSFVMFLWMRTMKTTIILNSQILMKCLRKVTRKIGTILMIEGKRFFWT